MSQSRTLKAGILGSGTFLVKLTALISAAILSRLFTKTDYAAYRQTILVYAFVAPLLMLGLPHALYYFLPRNRENGRSILNGNLLLLFLMGALFPVAMWCGGNDLLAKRFSNPELSRLLLVYSPYALLVVPFAAIGSCLVSCDKVKTLAVFNVANRLVVFICVIGLVIVWRTPGAAISGIVAAELLVFFPALFLMYRAANKGDWRPTRTNLWEQIKYCVPLGAATMMATITLNLDKILVSSMRPPDEFAVYANGAVEIPLIDIITGSVIAILIPEFAGMYQRREYTEILGLWHRAMVKCALLLFPIMVFLFVLAPEVMRVLFSAKYTESAAPFRVYLLALLIRITTFGAIFMAAGRNRLILYRSLIELVLNLFLSIILIQILGAIGAAIATVLVLYFWSIPFNFLFLCKILKTGIGTLMPLGRLAKVMLISVGAGVVLFAVPLLRPLGDFFVVVISGLLYGSLVLVCFDFFNFIKIKDVIRTIKSR